MRLLFVGAPGSGKGTQAGRLAVERDVPHISTGDILREAIRQSTPVGLEAKKFVEAGNLVPDGVMIGLIEERFGKGDTADGYILDGFPRTVPQAEALDVLLDKLGQSLDKVLLLECPDSDIVARITGRRTCEKCGTPYHVTFKKPKQDGACDRDGSPLVQRKDDTEEKVAKRLEKYHAETAAVIPHYDKGGLVCKIDATKPPDAVYGLVKGVLEG